MTQRSWQQFGGSLVVGDSGEGGERNRVVGYIHYGPNDGFFLDLRQPVV